MGQVGRWFTLRFADQVAVRQYHRRCATVTRTGEMASGRAVRGPPETEPGQLAL